MSASSPEKTPHVAVLVKRSSYRTFVLEGHDTRVSSLVARGDPTVKRMRRSHEDHQSTLAEVKKALADLGATAHFHEGPRTTIQGPYDLVVTVGGDGTLLAASHQLGPEIPILGVNSAPESSVGFFCAAKKGNVEPTLRAALEGRLRGIELARMRVTLNDRILHNRVLNEALFCHACPAATSRYILRVARHDDSFDEEEQKSSGLWIGPAAGSTAAQRSAGGRVLPLTSRRIQFVVREPYTPEGSPLRMRMGLVDEEGVVTVRSKMRQAKIFLDGHHNEYDAEMGDVITLCRSDETLTVLGLTRANGGVTNDRGHDDAEKAERSEKTKVATGAKPSGKSSEASREKKSDATNDTTNDTTNQKSGDKKGEKKGDASRRVKAR